MAELKQNQTSLLDDLEAIRTSLDKIAASQPSIPTLEEIVGKRPPTSVNPRNPFLSSDSLSRLIKIRNEAEARAAEELASIEPVRNLEEILAKNEQPDESATPVPDPEFILSQMENLFNLWVEEAVAEYLNLFESELRNRLQQDFRQLITHWYQEHQLPIPPEFLARLEQRNADNDSPDEESRPQPSPSQ